MTNQCIWKNIKWNNEYDQYWSFANTGSMDSVEFQNLRKCFREVFGLDISFNGNYFEASINAGIPTILLKSAAAPRIFISGLQPNEVLRMRKEGSDNTNMQTRYADENGEVILEGGTGGTQGSSDIYYYFGEIGIGQLAIATYLFNNERLDNLNLKTAPYLHNTIEVVDGAAKDSHEKEFSNTGTIQAYADVEKDYRSSVNSTVSKEILNKIGVNKITIPRYKISENNNEYHFEVLSFPYNRIQMTDDEKKSGQFCHDGDMQLTNDDKVDAKYWSTTPHIYPEIVFQNWTTMMQANNTITIEKHNNSISVNDKTYQILENDLVLLYVRKEGCWHYGKKNGDTISYYSNLSVSSLIGSSSSVYNFPTGCIVFSKPDIYLLSENITITPTSSYDSLTLANHDYFNNIISYQDTDIVLNSLSNVHDHASSPDYKRLMCVAGNGWEKKGNKYNYPTTDFISNNYKITLYNFPILNVSNYDIATNSNIDDNPDKLIAGDVSCYVRVKYKTNGSYQSGWNSETYLKLISNFNCIWGSLPSDCLFASDTNNKNDETPTQYGREWDIVNGNGRQSFTYNEYECSSQHSFGRYHSFGGKWFEEDDNVFTLCGFRRKFFRNQETSAVAVVIWRNGKLVS